MGYFCGGGIVAFVPFAKRIMRVITNSKYIAHTDPLFKTLNLHKLLDLYRLQLYKLYYKIKKQTVPAYFRHILTEVVNPYV